MTMCQKLPLIATLAITTFAGSVHADEPRGLDWGKAIVELDRYVRAGGETPQSMTERSTSGIAPIDDPSPQNMGNAWFGVAPRVTLVARDWASSTRLAGDRLSVVETMRLTASTRMVVSRVRLNNARFTPFVQLGVGQWRVDRNYLPHLPSSIEIASQVGAGFELRLRKNWQLAAEATGTTLIREGQNEYQPQTVLWGSFVASRIEF